MVGGRGRGRRTDPGVIEFCLDANEVALFLVLVAEDLELFGLERTERQSKEVDGSFRVCKIPLCIGSI